MRLSEEEFWHQTFYETSLLTERYRLVQEREDRRASFATWVLVNVHRDTERKPEAYDFQEVVAWLGHGFQRLHAPVIPEPPTPDEVLQKVEMLNQLYGGVDQRNTK